MNKIILQGLLTVAIFFGAWVGLKQIDWVTLFKVEETANKTEEKLGEMLLDFFEKEADINTDIFVKNTIDSIVTKICDANNIDRKSLKVHVHNKDEINAFALVDGHLVIYSGLILNAESQEELSGVIGHEIAHIELNHVMQKLVKEVGLSVLISVTTGGTGADVIGETAKMLTSSAFDRNLEKEADIKAVAYLIKAKIDPAPLANFMYRLALEQKSNPKFLRWVSTHPESKDRALYILEHSKDEETTYEPVVTEKTWAQLKEVLKEENVEDE